MLEPKNRSNSRRGAKIQSREKAEDRCDRARLQSSVLGFLGEKDASVPPQAVRRLEAELKDAGKGFEFHIYKDVKHGFLMTPDQGLPRRERHRLPGTGC